MSENKMTKEEALEKYGDVVLKFSSYYKYTFHFSGMADDGVACCRSYGGSSDDIYRYDVSADMEYKFSEFLNDEDEQVSIYENGVPLFYREGGSW